jgi:hypothetical protein
LRVEHYLCTFSVECPTRFFTNIFGRNRLQLAVVLRFSGFLSPILSQAVPRAAWDRETIDPLEVTSFSTAVFSIFKNVLIPSE